MSGKSTPTHSWEELDVAGEYADGKYEQWWDKNECPDDGEELGIVPPGDLVQVGLPFDVPLLRDCGGKLPHIKALPQGDGEVTDPAVHKNGELLPNCWPVEAFFALGVCPQKFLFIRKASKVGEPWYS